MGQRYFDLSGPMPMHLMCRKVPLSYSLFTAFLDSDTAHVFTRQLALKCNVQQQRKVFNRLVSSLLVRLSHQSIFVSHDSC